MDINKQIIETLRDMHTSKWVNPIVALKGIPDMTAGFAALDDLHKNNIIERKAVTGVVGCGDLFFYRYSRTAMTGNLRLV